MKIRLDKIIVKFNPSLSRADARKLIESGGVFAGGKKILKPDEQFEESEKIEITGNMLSRIIKSREIDLNPDSSVEFGFIYEGEDFAVIEKPAGLAVHPSHSHRKGTLANGLLAKWPQTRGVGEDPARPGIVHRLDKDVSGIMAIAKTNKGFFHLKKQFQNRSIKKTYIALVYGKPPEEKGVIKGAIARSKFEPTKQIISGKGKEAITEYRIFSGDLLPNFNLNFQFPKTGFSLLEVRPLTGRMHQIRVHLAGIGCPIAGDKKYLPKNLLKIDNFGRIMLHSQSLEIELMDGKRRKFESRCDFKSEINRNT